MNVFLDTMVYLHCVPVDQIDFCSIFGTDAVTILVPRVTFKELENHKATHRSSRIRDRSRQALSFLEIQIESDSPVRDGVSIQFIPSMPQVDMEAHGLNPAWNDDLLIASVLEWKEQNPSVNTILVTHDTGARLTCHLLGIRAVELPNKYHLQPELDESEKENQRLRRELQKMQNALPRIIVGFGDELVSTGHFSLEAPKEVDESLISQTLLQLKDAVPELAKKHKQSDSVDSSLSRVDSSLSRMANMVSDSIPDEEFDRYNEERLAYFDKYERYIRAIVEAENVVKRSIRFTIAISNTGSAPADDVDVRLNFPDGFVLYTKDDLHPSPKEPKRPTKPQSTFQILQSSIAMPKLALPRMQLADLSQPLNFQLRKISSYEITDYFTRIKHGFTEQLPELVLTFDSYDGALSTNCNYEISVANLPEPVKGKLHFVIEKDNPGRTPGDA